MSKPYQVDFLRRGVAKSFKEYLVKLHQSHDTIMSRLEWFADLHADDTIEYQAEDDAWYPATVLQTVVDAAGMPLVIIQVDTGGASYPAALTSVRPAQLPPPLNLTKLLS